MASKVVSPSNMKKGKQIAFIALVSVATTVLVNSLAKRFAPAAKVQQKIASGF